MIVKSCFDISYNIKVEKVSCKMIGVRSVKNEEILQFGVNSISILWNPTTVGTLI